MIRIDMSEDEFKNLVDNLENTPLENKIFKVKKEIDKKKERFDIFVENLKKTLIDNEEKIEKIIIDHINYDELKIFVFVSFEVRNNVGDRESEARYIENKIYNTRDKNEFKRKLVKIKDNKRKSEKIYIENIYMVGKDEVDYYNEKISVENCVVVE